MNWDAAANFVVLGREGPDLSSPPCVCSAGSVVPVTDRASASAGVVSSVCVPLGAACTRTGDPSTLALIPSLSLSGQLNQNTPPEGHGKGPLLRKVRLGFELMERRWNVDHLLCVTLTFADGLLDMAEANRRFNSLATNVLNARFEGWAVVVHRRPVSMTVHFHLLVATEWDVGRQSYDFEAARQGHYRGVAQYLREEWAFWRSITNYDGQHPGAAYPFGRAELEPIKTSGRGYGGYVIGAYLKRGMGVRLPEDRGCRMVRFSSEVSALLKAHFFNAAVVSATHYGGEQRRRAVRDVSYASDSAHRLLCSPDPL